ncbi:MAG: phosphate ABC transporter permease PstC, partial [Limnohabitans sp.]
MNPNSPTPLDTDESHTNMAIVAKRQRLQDAVFHRLTQSFSLLVLVALVGIIVSLFVNAWPTFAK